MTHTVSPVLLAQTVLLLAFSFLIVYPVWAYAQNVMHTGAVILLAISLLCITAGAIVESFLHMPLTAHVFHVLSALTFTVSQWKFAREFLRFKQGSTSAVAPSVTAEGEGFENVD
jgi:hypothetical protein